MFFCVLIGGHGSTMCTTLLPATASPEASEMASRRSQYMSEQPASRPASVSAAASRRRPYPSIDRIASPLRKVKHVAAVRTAFCAGGLARKAAGGLGLAQKKQVAVVHRKRGIKRRTYGVAGRGGADQPGRHYDGEIGFLFLIRSAAEQGAEYRNVAQPRQLL